ncbi:MAG: WecB/TagA/CpsF family glycosyltransferase [Chloroflexi bacterium]|nr:WecB/TagA/CpsF family glycosyltransferase [Chloroflexota bacterium]
MATEALAVQKTPRHAAGKIVSHPTHPGREARRRIDLGGVLIDRVDTGSAVERIRGFLRSGTLNQIVTVNLDFVAISRRDSYFRETLNKADLAVADGMPLVWVSKLTDEPVPERLTGVELLDECCRVAVETDSSIFLLGAAPGVADEAALTLQERFPGLKIAGVYAPPFGPLTHEENERILATINAAQPEFLFVALGAPQQDIWIRANRDRLDVPVAMGVGCVLDLLAGVVSRAPRWMQHAGLEWLFRLLQEPHRLWRRYILDDMPVLFWLVRQARERSRMAVPAEATP